MEKKLLPIGSVVKIKSNKRKIAIIGFHQKDCENTDILYDYCGVIFPNGYINSKKVLRFNQEEIEMIYHQATDYNIQNKNLTIGITQEMMENKTEIAMPVLTPIVMGEDKNQKPNLI